MANILERYGIKEVAEVTFYEIGEGGKPKKPVLFLDSLKVSTIEQTGELAEAKGGKGNASLIAWDYNKEITVNLEDALFSAKSMAIMFGDGTTKGIASGEGSKVPVVMRTETFIATDSAIPAADTETKTSGWDPYVYANGQKFKKLNPKFYDSTGTKATTLVENQTYFCSYDVQVEGSVIEISANSFPGTYYVTGDTYARSATTGKDEAFQFIIPKAKVQSENTIELQADGDPSVFKMDLKVLRPDDGVMMKLVKYNLDKGIDVDAASTTTVLPHNHALDPKNAG